MPYLNGIFPQRLFFLNGEQNLSEFLLVDMEKVKYPTYTCIISEPIFSKRSDLLSYEEVHVMFGDAAGLLLLPQGPNPDVTSFTGY